MSTPPRKSNLFNRVIRRVQTNGTTTDKSPPVEDRATKRKTPSTMSPNFYKRRRSKAVELITLEQVHGKTESDAFDNYELKSTYFGNSKSSLYRSTNKVSPISRKRRSMHTNVYNSEGFEGCQVLLRMVVFFHADRKQKVLYDPEVDIAQSTLNMRSNSTHLKFICRSGNMNIEVEYSGKKVVRFDSKDIAKIWVLRECNITSDNPLSCFSKPDCFGLLIKLRTSRFNKYQGSNFQFSTIMFLFNTTKFEFDTVLPINIWKEHIHCINQFPTNYLSQLIDSYHSERIAYSELTPKKSSRIDSVDTIKSEKKTKQNNLFIPSESSRRSERIKKKKEEEIYLEPEEAAEIICYYPPGTHKIKITRGDVARLNEEVFLNDTLISFYLQYIVDNYIQSNELRDKTYIFSTFFWEQLVKPIDGKPKNFPYHRRAAINFDNVKRWLIKLDIFSKKVIVIPFNQSLHWSVGVLCNLDNIDDAAQTEKRPVFIYCDSLPTSFGNRCFKTVKQVLKQLLIQEKKLPEVEVKELLLRIPLATPKLPCQLNSYDCGIYLLSYVERILMMIQEYRISFTSQHIQNNLTKFLNESTFNIDSINNKRQLIKRKINNLKRKYEKSLRINKDVANLAESSDSENAIEEISKEEYYAENNSP